MTDQHILPNQYIALQGHMGSKMRANKRVMVTTPGLLMGFEEATLTSLQLISNSKTPIKPRSINKNRLHLAHVRATLGPADTPAQTTS